MDKATEAERDWINSATPDGEVCTRCITGNHARCEYYSGVPKALFCHCTHAVHTEPLRQSSEPRKRNRAQNGSD